MYETVVQSLHELGLSVYEAKLYVALLAYGPQNGNELSRASGVPSSKVYATLDRLTAAGFVNHITRDSGAEYVCVPPAELLALFRDRYQRPLDHLEKTLPTIAAPAPELDVVQISNARALVDNARTMVNEARRELLISIWDENIEALIDELRGADDRGVKIFGMIYGETRPRFGSWQHHSYLETVAARIGGHMLTVVADANTALIAHVPRHGSPVAVRTRNPVLCLIAEEYLRHDLVLQKAKTMTGYAEWDAWLHTDDDVRALTLGRGGLASSIDPDAAVGASSG